MSLNHSSFIRAISRSCNLEEDLNPGEFTSAKGTHELAIAVASKIKVSTLELAQALAIQFGIPFIDASALNHSTLPQTNLDISFLDRHTVLPIFERGSTLYLAVADPTDSHTIDEVNFATGKEVSTVLCDVITLKNAIGEIDTADGASLEDMLGDGDLDLDIGEDDDDDNDKDAIVGADDAPVVKYVNKLLVDAINEGASDIHIEPSETDFRVRFRVDGILHERNRQPIALAPRVAARVKIISKLDIAERRIPQDGRIKLKLSQNKAFDFRVNTLPTVYGEKVVLRLLDSSAANLDLEILGFTQEQLAIYRKTVSKPYGMVLITGPTGSGKTVTLYSALNMLNEPTKNISTVEDPVEIMLKGITQVNINERANLNFAEALRAFLRQDPDIIMLGEIRDLETAEIAIKASQTGHLVLSTLHTNNAPATLTRLLNMGVPTFNVASAVELIVAQRLARVLCNECKVPIDYPESSLKEAGLTLEDVEDVTIYDNNSDGCAACTGGYKGRTGVYQVMPVTEEIKGIILAGGNEQDIEQAARNAGVLDLRAAGLRKVLEGVTTIEEVGRITNV